MSPYEIIQTETFKKLLSKLDENTQLEILEDIHTPQTLEYIRIYQETGVPPNKKIGICRTKKNSKYIGKILEIRIQQPKEYRVYFILRDDIILLYGGNKDDQDRDIKKASDIAANLKMEDYLKSKKSMQDFLSDVISSRKKDKETLYDCFSVLVSASCIYNHNKKEESEYLFSLLQERTLEAFRKIAEKLGLKVPTSFGESKRKDTYRLKSVKTTNLKVKKKQ